MRHQKHCYAYIQYFDREEERGMGGGIGHNTPLLHFNLCVENSNYTRKKGQLNVEAASSQHTHTRPPPAPMDGGRWASFTT